MAVWDPTKVRECREWEVQEEQEQMYFGSVASGECFWTEKDSLNLVHRELHVVLE